MTTKKGKQIEKKLKQILCWLGIHKKIYPAHCPRCGKREWGNGWY